MKKSILIFLVVGVAIIFSGCSKDDSLAPVTSPDEQMTPALKFSGTPYSGTTIPTGLPTSFGEKTELPNGNVKIFGFTGPWYETVRDEFNIHLPLLSGPSVYCENVAYNKWEPDIHFWGNVEITPEEGGGVWQGQFNGYGTFQFPPDPETGYDFFTDPTKVEDLVVRFTGHGGDIQGMVAKAKYNLDMVNTGLVYYIEGEYK